MSKYLVRVRRIEEWEDKIAVTANTPAEAVSRISELLEQGWSKVFGDNDGDCHECSSNVVAVQCGRCFALMQPLRLNADSRLCNCGKEGEANAS